MKKEDRNGQEKKTGSVLTTVLLIVAIAVFAFAAWKLIGYYLEYKAGSDEYRQLNEQVVDVDDSDQSAEDSARTQGGSASAEGPGGEEETVGEDTTGTGDYVPGTVLDDVEQLEDPETVEEKVAQAAKEETTEDGEEKLLPVMKNPIDFDQLQQINPEVIGWLRIGALDLSYPVAQAADNSYYLHRTFKREENFAGCIFLNCDNSKYFTDQNSIVYGHNMKNGSMFGTLRKFREQETYDENPYFWIFTPTLIYQYRIFSCHEVAKSGEPYLIRFTKQNFQSFIDTMQAESLVDNHGVEVTADDRVVTLSTCTGNDETRFIVQGKLEQVYRAQ